MYCVNCGKQHNGSYYSGLETEYCSPECREFLMDIRAEYDTIPMRAVCSHKIVEKIVQPTLRMKKVHTDSGNILMPQRGTEYFFVYRR